MFRHLTRRAIQVQIKTIFIWTSSLILFVLCVLALWKPLKDSGALDGLTDGVPQDVTVAFGIKDFSSPEGYLNGNLFGVILPFLFGFIAVLNISSRLCEIEKQGRLELMFSLPVKRYVISISRFSGTILFLVSCFLGIAVPILAGILVLDMSVDCGNAICACLGVMMLGVFHAGLAYLMYCCKPEKWLVSGVAGGILVLGYILYSVLPVVPELKDLKLASPWYWALGDNVLVSGGNWLGLAVLVLLSVLMVIAGGRMIYRRDISNA